MQAIINKLSIIAVVGTLGLASCSKPVNPPIDNSGSIIAPYVLFSGTNTNTIEKSNNDNVFDYIKHGGGSVTQAIWSADTNLLFINNTVNVGNGMQLPKYFPVVEPSFNALLKNATIEKQGYPNMSYYDAARSAVYVCGLTGIYLSEQNGKIGTWIPAPFTGTVPNAVNSVTKLDNGDVYCTSFGFKLYKRTNGTGNFVEVPISTKPKLAAGQLYFISGHGLRLIATDLTANSGAYYSDDGGVNWAAAPGLPLLKNIGFSKRMEYTGEYYSAADTLGLYKLNANNFDKVTTDLPNNIIIYDMCCKRNLYRTGVSKYYYFLASNFGLYKSDNNGLNWVKIRDGHYTALR